MPVTVAGHEFDASQRYGTPRDVRVYVVGGRGPTPPGETRTSLSTPNRVPNVIYLAANVKRKGDPRPHLDGGEDLHLDLTTVDMAAEIEWFKTAFAKELKKLESVYANVVVKWGFHQYFF